MTISDSNIEETVLRLLGDRAPTASICPSDVARALAAEEGAWRALMPSVRQVAARMARDGRVFITKGTDRVDPERIEHGPIRLRRGPGFSSSP